MTEPSADSEWIPWLRLSMAAGIGKIRATRLLEVFETPERILSRSPEELVATDGVPLSVARRLVGDATLHEARNELVRARALGVRLVRLGGPGYPQPLDDLYYPPVVLGSLGAYPDPGPRAIAIVGSREAGYRALRAAYDFGRAFASEGIVVVSGLAKGVDRAAHEGALAAPEGRTIAVLGHGLSRVYPAQHARLASRIRERGALVSELPADAPPTKGHFPMRNRIIAALSRAVVIIAAGGRSGALITARHAVTEVYDARPVFALPGSVEDRLSDGTNRLIADGHAFLVKKPDDVLMHEQLGWKLRPPDFVAGRAAPDRPAPAALEGVPGQVARYLETEGRICTFDEIVFANRLDARAAIAALGHLAVRRRVREVPGAGYEAVG